MTGVLGTRQVDRHRVHLLQLHWQLDKAQLDPRAFVAPQLTDVFIICCSVTGNSSSLGKKNLSGGPTSAVFVPLQMCVNVKVPERYFGKCVYYLYSFIFRTVGGRLRWPQSCYICLKKTVQPLHPFQYSNKMENSPTQVWCKLTRDPTALCVCVCVVVWRTEKSEETTRVKYSIIETTVQILQLGMLARFRSVLKPIPRWFCKISNAACGSINNGNEIGA